MQECGELVSVGKPSRFFWLFKPRFTGGIDRYGLDRSDAFFIGSGTVLGEFVAALIVVVASEILGSHVTMTIADPAAVCVQLCTSSQLFGTHVCSGRNGSGKSLLLFLLGGVGMHPTGNAAITIPLAEHIYVATLRATALRLLAAKHRRIDLRLRYHTGTAAAGVQNQALAYEPFTLPVFLFHEPSFLSVNSGGRPTGHLPPRAQSMVTVFYAV